MNLSAFRHLAAIAVVLSALVCAELRAAAPTIGITTFDGLPFTVSSGYVVYGNAQVFSNMAGWDISVKGFTSGNISIYPSNNVTIGANTAGGPREIALRANDGSAFDLQSFVVSLGWQSTQDGDVASATLTGYLQGSAVSGATATLNLTHPRGTGLGTAQTFNLSANAHFNDIDEFRITLAVVSGVAINSAEIDNISILAPTIPPAITSATYDASTGVLVVTGSQLGANGAGADIDVSKLAFTGEGGATYTLTDSADVEIDSATQFTVTLSATDKAGVNPILNKNGTSSTNATTYNLAGAADFVTASVGADDLTGNGITVSNVATPTIVSADYDASTGVLVVTGANLLSAGGSNNDIVANKLGLRGEGGDAYTLTDTASVDITSGTSFTVTLSATDRAGVNRLLNKNGTMPTANDVSYNLAAFEDWAAGADSAVVIADTSNAVTVSNVPAPTLTSATYDTNTGVLVVTGSGFTDRHGPNNDIDVSKLTLTGEGGATYSLTSGSVEITSTTQFSVTLNGTDKTAVNALLNKNGTKSLDATTYNLSADEDWAAGSDAGVVIADTTGNPVTASGVVTAPVAGLGGALNLEKANHEGVQVANTAALNLGTSSFTVEAWIKRAGGGVLTEFYTIAAKQNGSGGAGWFLRFNRDDNIVSFSAGSNAVDTTDTIVDTAWHHVAAVRDVAAKTMTVYIDGVMSKSAGFVAADNVDSAADFGIGLKPGYGEEFDGAIDDVRLWSTARTVQQIRDSMRTPLAATEAGLVGYWNFEDSSGTFVANRTSIGGLDATIQNPDGDEWISGNIGFNAAVAEDTALVLRLGGSDIDDQASAAAVITVLPGHGSLYQTNDGSTVGAQIGSADTALSDTGGNPRRVIYVPAANYSGTDSFTYKVHDGAVDSANTVTVNLTISAVDDAPAVTAGATGASYAEGGIAVQIDNTVTITDVDSANIASATVQVTGNRVSGDRLNFTDQNAIGGSFNAGTGLLTLTGSATKAEYVAALKSVTFDSTSDDPTDLLSGSAKTTRTITWKVNDGTTDSSAVTSGLTISAVNDAPVLAASNIVYGYTENGTTAPILSDITLADPDTTNFQTATLQISNPAAGDTLEAGTTTPFTSAYDTGTYTLTLSGPGTAAQLQAALQTVTFSSTSDDPTEGGTHQTRIIGTTVSEAGGSPLNSNTLNFSVLITALNDAPAITSNSGGATASMNVAENTTAVTTVTASDVDRDTVTFSITGGADQAFFTIDGATGALAFAGAPNFETKADANADNVYEVEVTATDNGTGNLTDVQAISVTITNVNEAPSVTSGATASFAENGMGTIYTVTGSDPDAGTSFTYAISGGTDAARFNINSATGAVTFVSPPNFEAPADNGADNVYDIQVTASDGVLTSAAVAVAITVSDAADAPVITSNGGGATASISVAENTTAVTTVTATDEDADAVTFTITGGADQGFFSINRASGALTFASARNFEAKADADADNVYQVQVTATDNSGGTLTDVQDISVTVTNVNEAPSVTSGATANFAENGTGAAYTVTGSDPDAGTTLTFALSGGADAGLFDIDGSTGTITFKNAPDFETPADHDADNVYDLQVTASDGSLTSPAAAVAITVTDVNEAPGVTSATSASFAENASGTVYTVTGSDPDAGTTLTYAISGGVDAARFNINSATGALTFAGSPNFEAPADIGANNVYDLQVTASDGALTSPAVGVAITVTNVNEAPSVTSGATASFAENGTGTAYTVTGGDPDAGTSFTYAISGGADAALFDINSSTGAVTFKVAPDFEAPADNGANNVYDIQVTASDGGLTSSAASVALTVTDVDEPPVFSSSSTASAVENQTAAFTAAATDPEAAALTYSIVGGADAAKFAIDGTTGGVTFVTAPDFENPTDTGANNIYDVTVRASDGTNTADLAVAVTVGDANDAPVVTSAGTANFAESGSGTVYTVTATDQDPGTTLTYAISGGADAALFSIDASTGAIAFLAAPSYASPADTGADNVYDLTVTASDGTLTSVPRAVAITILDRPDIVDLDGDAVAGGIGVTSAIDAHSDATVSDLDSADFNTGELTVTRLDATRTGDFSLDGTNATAGADAAIADNEAIIVSSVTIGTVQAGSDGQGDHDLVIGLNSNATPGLVSTLLRSLRYTPGTANSHQFAATISDPSSGTTSAAVTFEIDTVPTITNGALTAGGTYGTVFGGYTITGSSSPTSFGATGLPAGLALDSTTGVISGTPTQTGTFNVDLTATNGSGTGPVSTLVVTIAKAPLTVTADAKSRIYGAANPTLTISYAGLVGGDTGSSLTTAPIASTAANGSSTPGTYAITVAGGVSDNYTFTYVPGVLTVNAAPQSIVFGPIGDVILGQAVTLSASVNSGLPVSFSLISGSGTLSGTTVTTTGLGAVTVRASQAGNGNYDSANNVDRSFNVVLGPPPEVTTPTRVPAPIPGGKAEISVVNSSLTVSYQWQRNGSDLPNANGPSLTLDDVQPPTAGLYTYTATIPGGGIGGTSEPVIVGLDTTEAVIGMGEVVGSDIVHPNGNVYDQVLLEGPAATVTAQPKKITRLSFIDLSNDIVQVEFSGAGTVSLVMDDASSPAPAENYNQPGVDYVKGHAGIVITGADETSNLSVISVGRVTAVNQSLFEDDVNYDGVANIAFVAIQSTNGKFGGIRTGNVHYFANTGFTGVYAPGVELAGPVNIGDVSAFDSATPVLVFGNAGTVNLTGGSLEQANGQSVKISGITQVKFVDGTTSQGVTLPAQQNAGVLVEDGVDVTAQIVVNP